MGHARTGIRISYRRWRRALREGRNPTGLTARARDVALFALGGTAVVLVGYAVSGR